VSQVNDSAGDYNPQHIRFEIVKGYNAATAERDKAEL
jgi:hypothetical protein